MSAQVSLSERSQAGKVSFLSMSRESTKAERIRHVRKLARMTQEQFADALQTTRGAVGNWELGKGIKAENLTKIADVFGISADWLIRQHGSEPDRVRHGDHIASEHILPADRPSTTAGRKVKLKGYVGAGAEAHYYRLADEDYEEVEAPLSATDQTVAVEIKGTSFGPLMNTWLVFYDDVRSPVTQDLIGSICVVGLADDRILIKQIRRERNGSYTLVSNSDEPPIENAEIEWAAKVTDMRPRA